MINDETISHSLKLKQDPIATESHEIIDRMAFQRSANCRKTLG